MTYLVTIISLTPDTRLTEKREAFSMTLMVCVICVETLSRMRSWSRPAGDSRLDDDVVACDGWLDDAIAAVGTLQPRSRLGRRPTHSANRFRLAANSARGGQNRRTPQGDYRKSLGTRAGRPMAGRYRLSRPSLAKFTPKFTGLWILGLALWNNSYSGLVSRCPLEVLHRMSSAG